MYERSGTLGDLRAGAPKTRLSVGDTVWRRDLPAVLVIALTCVALAAATWRAWGDLWLDVGYDLLAASRVAEGELPYVDFVYYYGPLGPAVLGLGTWLSGDALGVAIGTGLVTATLIVLGTYALARTQVDAVGAALAAGITAPLAFAPNNLSYVLPHSFSASFAILLTLGLLVALARYAATGRRPWLAVVGASAGLLTLTRPEFAVAAVAALGLWLVLRRRAGIAGHGEAAVIAVPLVLIPAAAYGLVLTRLSLDQLLFRNLYPVDALGGSGNTLLRSYAPFTFSSFASIGLRTALYCVGAVGLVLAAWLVSRAGRFRQRLLVALVLGMGLVAAASLVRLETARYYLEFAYAWIPVGAVAGVAVLLVRYRSASSWPAADQVALAAGVVLAVLGLKTYNAFIFHAPEPQLAVYAAPFAAIFLARLHLRELARSRDAFVLGAAWLGFLVVVGAGLALRDSSVKSVDVVGRQSLRDDPADARVFGEALRWIERSTRPGDYILVAPQLQALYVLSARRDPLDELSLLPGALGDREGELAAIEELERHRVRLVVIDEREFPEFEHGAFGDSFSPTLARWIESRFARVAILEGTGEKPRTIEVWARPTGFG